MRRVGALNIPGFVALPYERKIELLALIAKIRGLRHVHQSDVALLPSGEYVAWAAIHNELVEKRATRLESALQELYVDLKTSYPSATPPRR